MVFLVRVKKSKRLRAAQRSVATRLSYIELEKNLASPLLFVVKNQPKISSTTENTIKKLFLNTSAGKQKVIEGQVKFA